MDDRAHSSRTAVRNRGIAELWKVNAGASVLDGRIHPGGVTRGGTLQEGSVYRKSKSLAVDTRRRRTARNAGNYRERMVFLCCTYVQEKEREGLAWPVRG